MYREIPLYRHNHRPEDVINPVDMELLQRHYRATAGKKPDEFARAVKIFNPGERERVAAAISTARAYGFVIAGTKEDCTIRWGIITARKVDSMLNRMAEEDGLPRGAFASDGYRLPDGELRRLRHKARDNFRSFRESVTMNDHEYA